MKKTLLILAVATVLAGCTRPEQATGVPTANGFKNIVITGYSNAYWEQKRDEAIDK